MSVQFSSNQIELYFPNLEKSLQFRQDQESESDNLFHDSIQGEDENVEDFQMADHLRPMEELLRIPIVGIENAIVVPAILADHFELKPELLNFVSNNSFFALENDDPHSHIRRFYQITQTLRLNQVSDDVVKLILFLFSLKGAAEKWLENEPPSGGNLMTRNTQDALTIIENKARVRTCRNKPQVSSSYGSSIQIDAITTLTKHFEALISSMQEAYNRNQEATIQLMQNQMGQMDETFQKRPSCVPPSDTKTDPREERKAVTTMSGLTLDGSFIPHFLVYQEKEQELKTITKVVEIASSKSTPLVPPPEIPPLIDIVDSLCDKFHIENNSLSGNPTPSSDSVVESLFPSLTPSRDIDLLLEETDAFLSLDDSIPPGIDNDIYDLEGDILFLDELLNDEIPRDLPPKELKDDEPSMSKSLIEKPLDIDNEIYDSEGDILFLEKLLKDKPSEVVKSEIYTLIGEPPDTFLMEDEEIKLNPLKDSDDSIPIPRVSVTPLDSLDSFFDSYDTSYTNPSELNSEYTLNYDNQIFNIQNEHCDEPKTETIMDEAHSTIQIPPLFEGLTSDKSMQDIILQ
ncbi:hypothetical protein Tco_0104868 [Tanacetum coccineum]